MQGFSVGVELGVEGGWGVHVWLLGGLDELKLIVVTTQVLYIDRFSLEKSLMYLVLLRHLLQALGQLCSWCICAVFTNF